MGGAALPIGLTLLSSFANQSGKGDETPSPKLPKGLEFLLPLFQELSRSLAGLLPGINQVATAGVPAFSEGLQTGFAPDVLPALRESLMPELELARQRATGATLGNAAALGTLTGSGTTRAVGDVNTQLEAGVLSQLGTVGAQAELQGQNIRGQFASQALGLPFNLLQLLFGGIAGAPFNVPAQGPSKLQSLAGPAAQLGSAYFAGGGGGGGK